MTTVRRVCGVLGVVLLCVLQTCAQTTSEFRKYFIRTNRLPLIGATVYLVPQANTYPTGALTCTPDALRPGEYYRAAVPDGEYKIYIDQGAGAVLVQQNVFIGEKRLTDIANKFENYQLTTGGIKDAAVTTAKILDGTIVIADLATSLVQYIDAAGGGSITNFPDENTITVTLTGPDRVGVKPGSITKAVASDSIRKGLMLTVADSVTIKTITPTILASGFVYMHEVAIGAGYGGGVFERVTQTAALDKGRGVYTFPADAGFVWERIEHKENPGVVSLSWAGAKPDGVSDAWAGIDRASKSGAGTVEFEQGTYQLLTTSASIVVPDNVTWQGRGMRRTLLKGYRTYAGLGPGVYANQYFDAGNNFRWLDMAVRCIDSVSVVLNINEKKGVELTNISFSCDSSDGSFIRSVGGRGVFTGVEFYHKYSYNTWNTFSCFSVNGVSDATYASKRDTSWWYNCRGASGAYVWGGTGHSTAYFFNCYGNSTSDPIGGNVLNLYQGCDWYWNGGQMQGMLAAITPNNSTYRSKVVINGAQFGPGVRKIYSSDVGESAPRLAQDSCIITNCPASTDTFYIGSPLILAPGTYVEIANCDWVYTGKRNMHWISTFPDVVGDSTKLKIRGLRLYGGGVEIVNNNQTGGKVLFQVDGLSVTMPDTPVTNNSRSLLYWHGIKKGSYLRDVRLNDMRTANPNLMAHHSLGGMTDVADSIMEITDLVVEMASSVNGGDVHLAGNYKLTRPVFKVKSGDGLFNVSTGHTWSLYNPTILSSGSYMTLGNGGTINAYGGYSNSRVVAGFSTSTFNHMDVPVVYSVSIDPATVSANTTSEQTFTVTGVSTLDRVYVNKPTHQAGLIVGSARVSAANTVAITFANVTGSGIDPASETYQFVTVRH